MGFLEIVLHRQPQISPDVGDVREPGIKFEFQVAWLVLGVYDNVYSRGAPNSFHVLAFCRIKPCFHTLSLLWVCSGIR